MFASSEQHLCAVNTNSAVICPCRGLAWPLSVTAPYIHHVLAKQIWPNAKRGQVPLAGANYYISAGATAGTPCHPMKPLLEVLLESCCKVIASTEVNEVNQAAHKQQRWSLCCHLTCVPICMLAANTHTQESWTLCLDGTLPACLAVSSNERILVSSMRMP